MARPLRIEYAGALYHVTSRGNGRENIYLDDEDRVLFLRVLGEVCDLFNWSVHAWCLMTNHYHLLVETQKRSVPKKLYEYEACASSRNEAIGLAYRSGGYNTRGYWKILWSSLFNGEPDYS